MELNPNHPVTRGIHDHWHKIAALVMVHFGVTQVTIPISELKQLEGLNICIHPDDEKGIQLLIVNDKEAARLARKEGGLPV
jgi:hypothetical protein